MSFGEKIRKQREQLNMTQEELSFEINEELSRQSVSKWERGESFPDVDNLLVLAKILNMSLDDMFSDELEKIGVSHNKSSITKITKIPVKNELPVICNTSDGATVRITDICVSCKKIASFYDYRIQIIGEMIEDRQNKDLSSIKYKLIDSENCVIDSSFIDLDYIEKGESFKVNSTHFLDSDLGNSCRLDFYHMKKVRE